MANRRRSAGYTMQELMVVVAIVGIAAAVAAGRLGGKGRQARDAQRFAERITTAIERARLGAVSSRQDQRVTIAPSSALFEAKNTTGTWITQERMQAPAEAKVWDVKSAAAIPTLAATATHTILFRPDFTVQLDAGPAINAHIYVSGISDSMEGHRFRIHVNGVGTVRMYENW